MMHCTSVAADVIQSFGSWCYIRGENEAEARKVKMVISQEGKGKPARASRTFNKMVDPDRRRNYAEVGLGIIMAKDAPEGMHQTMKLTVTDSLGKEWHSDGAVEVVDPDPMTGNLVVGAWRVSLYTRQAQSGGRI